MNERTDVPPNDPVTFTGRLLNVEAGSEVCGPWRITIRLPHGERARFPKAVLLDVTVTVYPSAQ